MGDLSSNAAIIMLVSSTLGSGILYMPAAFNQLGYGVGWLAIMAIAGLTWYSLYCLSYTVESLNSEKEQTYSSISENFSKKIKFLVDLIFIASNFGTCFIFMRRASDYATFLTIQAFGEFIEKDSIRISLLSAIALFTVRICMLDSLSSLAPLSKLSVGSALYYAFFMIFLGIYNGESLSELDFFNKKANFSFAAVLVLFAMHCQFAFLSIRHSLEDKSMKSIIKVVSVGTLLIGILYGSAGFFGYKAAGFAIIEDNVLTLITERKENPFLVGIEGEGMKRIISIGLNLIVYAFVIIFTIGIPCIAFAFIPTISDMCTEWNLKVKKIHIVLAIVLLLYVPNLSKDINPDNVLNFIGTFCTNSLSFFFPALFMSLISSNIFHRIFSFISILISLGLMVHYVSTKILSTKV